MRTRLAPIALLLLSGSVLWSQSATDRGGSPGAEVSGGFAMAGGGTLGTDKGFQFGADLRVRGPLYLAGEVTHLLDFSRSSSNSTADTSILAGPRFRFGGRGLAPFAEFLAGADVFHNSGQSYTYAYNNATNFALAANVGVDIPVSRRLAIRPTGGYFWTRLTNSTYGGPANPAYTTSNRGRFAIDLVYRF